jgi:uncharacterized protein YkwD
MRALCILLTILIACGGDDGDDGNGNGNNGGPLDEEPTELKGITAAHNTERDKKGVGPLEWDGDLAAIAQSWAEECQSDNGIIIDHNPNRGSGYPGTVGENIYAGGAVPNAAGVVGAWVSEEANYDYASNSCSGVCGHYTQVVWADSTKLGCGIANCPNLSASWNVVCDYSPAGNFIGERPY